MKNPIFASVLTLLITWTSVIADDADPKANDLSVAPATSEIEARTRAKMLHEMLRGTLQIMHRDFFDEEDANAIPSASLEDVFYEMGESYDIQIKWLVVNTDIVNVDHEAEGEFEKAAVKTLAAGKPYAEKLESDRYYFAGPIHLGSQCLKCHVKRRTSNETRTAGLVITIPMKLAAASSKSP